MKKIILSDQIIKWIRFANYTPPLPPPPPQSPSTQHILYKVESSKESANPLLLYNICYTSEKLSI